MSKKYSYDIAISFAGEDRDLVENIAMELKRTGVRIFYDKLEQHKFWGMDLYEYLADVYSKQAKFCIIFISKNYIRKNWTHHELKNAQSRAINQSDAYILPIKIDDTEIPGLPNTIGFLDSRNISKEEIIELILKKLDYPSTQLSQRNKIEIDKNNPIYWKILSVINSLDPIGLLPAAPSDEYDIEVDEIIKELDKINNEIELATLIHKVFVKKFNARLAGPFEGYLYAANQILKMIDKYTL